MEMGNMSKSQQPEMHVLDMFSHERHKNVNIDWN